MAGSARHSPQRAPYPCAFHTPRISLGPTKCAVRVAPTGTAVRASGGCGGVGCTGVGAAGVVPGGWYTGYLPSRAPLVLPGPNPLPDQRFCVHPGHSRPLLGPPHTLGSSHSNGLLEPIWARFSLIYPKVSHKSRVSTLLVDEACHSPCFKNPLKSHDLEFPRNPYTLAFSHKE